jgi:Gly-Xaa carboxypeptidase
MVFSKLALLAGAVGVSAHVAQSPTGGSVDAVDMASECRLPPAIDPSRDGLPHSYELWGDKTALSQQVKRLQAIIRVPSVCFDDLGPIGEDERWKPFDELHRVIEGLYPIMQVALPKFRKADY